MLPLISPPLSSPHIARTLLSPQGSCACAAATRRAAAGPLSSARQGPQRITPSLVSSPPRGSKHAVSTTIHLAQHGVLQRLRDFSCRHALQLDEHLTAEGLASDNDLWKRGKQNAPCLAAQLAQRLHVRLAGRSHRVGRTARQQIRQPPLDDLPEHCWLRHCCCCSAPRPPPFAGSRVCWRDCASQALSPRRWGGFVALSVAVCCLSFVVFCLWVCCLSFAACCLLLVVCCLSCCLFVFFSLYSLFVFLSSCLLVILSFGHLVLLSSCPRVFLSRVLLSSYFVFFVFVLVAVGRC